VQRELQLAGGKPVDCEAVAGEPLAHGRFKIVLVPGWLFPADAQLERVTQSAAHWGVLR
jgi:hypothetical protein